MVMAGSVARSIGEGIEAEARTFGKRRGTALPFSAMASRLLRMAIWALLGAALALGSVSVLDELGLALIIAALLAGLPLAAMRLDARSEALGLAAGPGVLFIVVAELDDAPGLVLIGLAILAATAAVYLKRPVGPATP